MADKRHNVRGFCHGLSEQRNQKAVLKTQKEFFNIAADMVLGGLTPPGYRQRNPKIKKCPTGHDRTQCADRGFGIFEGLLKPMVFNSPFGEIY